MSIKIDLLDRIRFLNELHMCNSRKSGYSALINAIRQFEKNRLWQSYTDFAARKEYRPAIEFMIEELFGKDQSKRDLEMERAYPAMIRLLPEYVLETVLSAIEFSIVTVSFERCMAEALLGAGDVIDEHCYCRIFRTGDCRAHREAQLMLMLRVGRDLDSVVHKPFISTTLRLCRQPAKLAKLSELQHFMERGFDAFKLMRSSTPLLQAFFDREQQIITKIMNGNDNAFSVSH